MKSTIPEDSNKKAVLDNFVAGSRLDGYEPTGSLAKKQLALITGHKGSQAALRAKLLKAYGG